MINRSDKIDKFITDALKKQFEVIGLKYDPKLHKKGDWFLKHSWNDEQIAVFKKWFIAEYKKRFKCLKRIAEKEYNWWFFDYGWGKE